ncbi:hypothetical protein TrVE_jg10948 [Triparma verrucosa]|uniref:Uncharacterized protein n=1 Tax=Triparma verrucosa TaxID=1606542 RepID=A0A9W7FMX0_9STRA|nr:hypothetical protein TrVE_jg10948 [Triparma verrucosa]
MQLNTCQADNCAAGSEPNLSGTMEYPTAGILLEDGPLVRLRNGSNQQVTFSSEDVDLGVIEGRMEVLSGGVWGTISDELFEYADAAVLCRELAAEQGYVATYVDDLSRDEVPSAPSSTTPVVWWKLGCNGNEEHVADCSKFNYPPRADGIYDHSKDAGIYCILESPQECVQCVAGKYQDSPTVSVNMCKNCPEGKLSPAGASSLLQCALCPQGTRGTQNDQGVPICEDCNDNSNSNQDRTACECDPGYEDRSLSGIELPDTSNIRLRTAAGSSPIFDEYEKVSGRIEVRAGFLWGSIKQTSANPWDDFNALVACKEIAAENGYDYVSANVLTLEATPDGSTDQLYEGFACTGSESTLDSCPRSSASSPKDPSLNVGIECSFYVSHWVGDCSPCQAGQYSDSPGMPCTPCEEGKFATSSATQTCTDCPAGKASDTAGATDPIVCGLCGGGTYSLAAASDCESCPSGKYSSASGTELNVACTDCSPGKVSSGGLAECSPCTSGHFQPLAGKGSCESCDAPFEVDASKVDCSCPAGTTDVYPSGRIGDAGTLRLRDASNAAPNFGVVGAGTVQGRVEVIPSGKASFGTISAESEWDNNAAHVACHQLGDALGYMLLSALPTTALETPDAGTDGSFIGQFWGDLECEGSEDYLQLCEGSSNYLAEDDLDHTKDVGVTCAYYPIQCQAGGDGTTPTPSPTMNPTPAPTDPESTSCPIGYDCRGGSPVACVAGKYSKGTLTGACLNCPVGSKCVGGAGKQPCQAGEYQSLVAQDFCLICEKGAYNPNRGQTSCTPCPLGTYNNDDGERRLSHDNLSDCTLCATGKYSSAAASSVCSNCAAGKSNGEAGSTLATQCEICGKGKYAVSGYECTDCPAGKFLDDARTAESYHDSPDDCFICGIGKYQSNVASTDCVVCPKGTYNNENAVVTAHHDSVDDCIVCPAGTYNAEAADAASKHDDVNDCVVCSSGKYLPDEATSAELHDSADDCIACAGKYTTPDSVESEETRTAASFCPSGYACRGGVKTSCVAGVTFQPDAGKSSCNVCSSCGPGKYVAMECTISSDRICESCPGGSASLGGQTECSECGDGKPTNNETSASICTTCPQYEELDLSIGYSVTACKCMPSFVRRLGNESCSCTPGHTLTGEECSPCEVGRFKDDYGVHSCSRCEDVLKNSVTLSKNSTTASECVCPAGKFDNLLGGSARMCEPVKKGMSTTVEAMTLSTVTVEPGFWRVGPQSIDIRKCPVSDACPGGNSSNYCREGHAGPYCNLCEPDYTKDPFQICQTCSSTTEDVVKSIMVITAILTFTGLIFYYAHKKHLGANTNYDRRKLSKRLLWVDRRKIQLPIEEREKDLELMAEAFLFEPYKPEFWYFEVVETIRRLCLTGVLSTVAPGSFSQLSIGLLMSIFFTTVFCKLEPYHKPRDNKIAILSSWQLVLVFLCSYFMKSASLLTNSVDDSADFEFMGYLLIFSFIAIIVLFVIYAIEQKDDFSEDAEEMAERILAEQSKSTMNMSLASLGSLKSISNMNSSSSRKVSFAHNCGQIWNAGGNSNFTSE